MGQQLLTPVVVAYLSRTSGVSAEAPAAAAAAAVPEEALAVSALAAAAVVVTPLFRQALEDPVVQVL